MPVANWKPLCQYWAKATKDCWNEALSRPIFFCCDKKNIWNNLLTRVKQIRFSQEKMAWFVKICHFVQTIHANRTRTALTQYTSQVTTKSAKGTFKTASLLSIRVVSSNKRFQRSTRLRSWRAVQYVVLSCRWIGWLTGDGISHKKA